MSKQDADNKTEDSGSWLVRTVRRGDTAVEVSLIANQRKIWVYRTVQYAVIAVIVLLAAFVPMFQTGSIVLDELTVTVLAKCGFVPGNDRAYWWSRQAIELTLRLAFALLIAKFMPQYTVQESILVVRDFGIQLRTEYTNGSSKFQFMDASSIKGVIINEGIQTCDIRYYMAIVVAGRKNLVLTFQSSRPRLPVLGRIFRDVHAVMFPKEHLDDDLYDGVTVGKKSAAADK